MKTKFNKPIYLALMLMYSAYGYAAGGSGGAPKGKPFVAINDQIVEVNGAISTINDQIEEIVADVDTMEERVTATETAITQLNSENVTLQTLVINNITDLSSINTKIQELDAAKTQILAQLQATVNTETLQAELSEIDGLITTLQQALLQVESGMISLENSLQGQIDNNNTLISAMQSQIDSINSMLALKQNLINGTCPDGSAIKQVLPDGSSICETVGGAAGFLVTSTAWNYTSVPPGGSARTGYATCPNDTKVISAGFMVSHNMWAPTSAIETSSNRARVDAVNNSGSGGNLFVQANCMKFTQ